MRNPTDEQIAGALVHIISADSIGSSMRSTMRARRTRGECARNTGASGRDTTTG
jgi:hypothetical protein